MIINACQDDIFPGTFYRLSEEPIIFIFRFGFARDRFAYGKTGPLDSLN